MKRFSLFVLLVVLACQSIVSSQDRVLKLDGDGDYVDLGQPDFMPQAYTLEIKIFRLESSNSLQGLISKDGRADGSGNYSIHWSVDNYNHYRSTQRLHHHGNDVIHDDFSIPNREWVHLAIVFTGSKLTFYTNGVAGNKVHDYSPSNEENIPK